MAAAIELGEIAYELAGILTEGIGGKAEQMSISRQLQTAINSRLVSGIPLITAIAGAFQGAGGGNVPAHIFQRYSEPRYYQGDIGTEQAIDRYIRARGLQDADRAEIREAIIRTQNADPNFIDAVIRQQRVRENRERNIEPRAPEHVIDIKGDDPLVDVPLNEPA